MKIAFVGKGGSGKSAMTWLFAQTLAEQGKTVYVIDADHNMDTAATFGITADLHTATFHRSHTPVRELLGLTSGLRWQTLLDTPDYPTAIQLSHPALESLWHKTEHERILVSMVGLGADDIIGSGTCAHGHSAPLKWLLPCLTPAADEVILVDGVAGADMMNYGLFSGADILIIVAEQHPNSERVAKQISDLATQTNIPYLIIGNRSTPCTLLNTATTIDVDPAISAFDFPHVTPQNKQKITSLISDIEIRHPVEYTKGLRASS